jgi:catechol 2,3-dioxygenase-like lactoylglutathione lyase family enzyme
MKRFHVHISVPDLVDSIRFYSALFAAEPTVVKSDYAKWMLDDPRVTSRSPQRGAAPGLDHLGVQVENDAELAEMHTRLNGAALPVDEQIGTACCYARSDKYWTVDPQGIAWKRTRRSATSPPSANPATRRRLNRMPTLLLAVPARGKPIGVPVKSSCC